MTSLTKRATGEIQTAGFPIASTRSIGKRTWSCYNVKDVSMPLHVWGSYTYP